MHDHSAHCFHELKFCSKCDEVYCKKCEKNWTTPCRQSHYSWINTTGNVPFNLYPGDPIGNTVCVGENTNTYVTNTAGEIVNVSDGLTGTKHTH